METGAEIGSKNSQFAKYVIIEGTKHYEVKQAEYYQMLHLNLVQKKILTAEQETHKSLLNKIFPESVVESITNIMNSPLVPTPAPTPAPTGSPHVRFNDEPTVIPRQESSPKEQIGISPDGLIYEEMEFKETPTGVEKSPAKVYVYENNVKSPPSILLQGPLLDKMLEEAKQQKQEHPRMFHERPAVLTDWHPYQGRQQQDQRDITAAIEKLSADLNILSNNVFKMFELINKQSVQLANILNAINHKTDEIYKVTMSHLA